MRTTPAGLTITACAECHQSLHKDSTKPPKFAIANDFFVGSLPSHLTDATWIEKIMTMLVTVVAQTRVMRGGRHRAIRSNCMLFDAMPGPPATLLPRRIDSEGSYRVVLAGSMTSQQNEHVRKLHSAGGSVVKGLLKFFKENNHLYDDVEIDQSSIHRMNSSPSHCEAIFIEHDGADAEESIRAEQDSVLGLSDALLVDTEDEEWSVIERNILLAPDEIVPDATFTQRVVDLNAHQTTEIPRLRVDHSSNFASSVNVDAKKHAHLFPFGRGHPDEERQTKVSKRDCLRYYSMLSSRQFARDPTFMLAAFTWLAVENMYTMTSVKCKRTPSIFQGYESISRDDLSAVLINNERRQRGQSRLNLPNPTADRFLKSVELGLVCVWGSGAERRQCRQEAFGYQTRHGQPNLFVTLTPNSENSYAMAHYTGILSVESLFDQLEARLPSRTEMKKAAMNDDCASARLFMRTVDAFVEEGLGIDSKTKKSRSGGGLFGKTRAYFGMAETQGRGTLHIHFLIWLFGAPTNSVEFDEKRKDGDIAGQLVEYVDSIVTNRLPLDVARCSRCGTAGEMTSLEIPASAHKQRSKRSIQNMLEPFLLTCTMCDLESSAQHIARQTLLQNRPPHWPPPLRHLTASEKKQRLDEEMRVRSSISEAERVIREREFLLGARVKDDQATIMAAFKCNHDIQFLCGGKDANNRIYYCCKYVTKPQRQIDSTTAIALASFQRRQLKEGEELVSQAPPSIENVRRRRVTSMVHTFTNKQEITGPLAALYLLRGSCCYSSDQCAKLPLGDVIRQLESSGDYSCTLIATDSEATTTPAYRPASFLDDYIYRPDVLGDTNLHEFTMRCYRRQRAATSAERHLFSLIHPLCVSHCLGFRQREAVPVIKGQRLPHFKD